MSVRTWVLVCAASTAAGLMSTGAYAQGGVNPTPIISNAQVGLPGSGNGLDVGVALGSDGTLAFRASGQGGGGGGGAVYVRSSGGGGVLLTIQGSPFGAARSLTVSNGGTLGFVQPGAPGSGDEMVSFRASSGGPLITIHGDNFGAPLSIASASLGGPPGGTELFTFSTKGGGGSGGGAGGMFRTDRQGGALLTIIGNYFSAGLSGVGDLDGDGFGDEAFAIRATDAAGNPGIFAARSGGAVLTISGNAFQGVSFAHVGNPSLSGQTMAFAGQTSSGDYGVYFASFGCPLCGTIPDLPSLKKAAASGLATQDVALNASMGLAFDLVDPVTGNVDSIYQTDLWGAQTTRLIGVGDVLDGATVMRLVFSAQGLNDAGVLAFYAELSDGTAGVFAASNVPGPGAVAVLIGGSGVMAGRRRRRT